LILSFIESPSLFLENSTPFVDCFWGGLPYHENFVNSGASVGLLGNSEKTGYNSDDSGIENDFDPNDNWVEYF